MEKKRLRRATGRPVVSQKAGSSGRQSSIHLPRLPGGCGGATVAVSGALVDGGRVGAAMPTTLTGLRFPGVAARLNSCSVSLTGPAPLW
jgi:hypothetical protein